MAPVRRSSLGSGPTLGHLSYNCCAGPSWAFPRGDSADSHMENRNGLLKGYSSIKAGGRGGLSNVCLPFGFQGMS